MSGMMVDIMLHGLIVLVPIQGANSQHNHMTALLINAREPRAELQCFVPHEAVLTISAKSDQCEAAGCSSNRGTCECKFEKFEEISLSPDVQPQPLEGMLRTRPERGLPFDEVEATSFAYIGNLSNLGQTVKRELLDTSTVPSPNPLIARMTFPFKEANACSLATRPDEGGKNVHPLNFREVGESEKPQEMSQALAQVFMAHYELPENSPPLTLTLRRSGANPRSIELMPGETGYSIRLENKRLYDLDPGDPCDDGIARDFGLYYDLAENPPALEDRLIPHVKYTRWKGANELLGTTCQRMKEPMSRPVCPIGSFYPGPSANGVAQ